MDHPVIEHPDPCQNGHHPETGKPPGITLVLGGGGARGVAHLGVLQVLEENEIRIEQIVANSAGALVGAAFLQSGSATALVSRCKEFLSSPHFRRLRLNFHHSSNGGAEPSAMSRLMSGWRRQVAMHLLFRRESLFHRRRLEGVIQSLVQDESFEDLSLPLSVVALDIHSGEEVVLDRGPLYQALTASCSVAGFFPPFEVEGRTLIDSGQSDNLPVGVARDRGPRPIVSVNLSKEMATKEQFATGIEIMFRSDEIGSHWNNRLRAQWADVRIAPKLGGRYWLDFSDIEGVIEAGAAATREVLPEIREALDRAPSSARSPQVS